jgi:Lon protease-like protein
MPDLSRIPLFPLNTVLFPGMLLPLHIFEERYKMMIQRCLDDKLPFGVVLIKEGNEVGPGAKVYTIGTMAYITEVDRMEDGRMNIATLGLERFKVLATYQDEPYMTGDIDYFPYANTETQQAEQEARRLEPTLIDYLQIIAKMSDTTIALDKMPTDPDKLAFLTAIVLRAPMKDKQDLLAIPSMPDLLRQERSVLTREIQVLKLMTENAPSWMDDSSPFSPN